MCSRAILVKWWILLFFASCNLAISDADSLLVVSFDFIVAQCNIIRASWDAEEQTSSCKNWTQKILSEWHYVFGCTLSLLDHFSSLFFEPSPSSWMTYFFNNPYEIWSLFNLARKVLVFSCFQWYKIGTLPKNRLNVLRKMFQYNLRFKHKSLVIFGVEALKHYGRHASLKMLTRNIQKVRLSKISLSPVTFSKASRGNFWSVNTETKIKAEKPLWGEFVKLIDKKRISLT